MNPKAEKMLRLAAIFGATAVALGAFGAHGLKSLFLSRQLDAVYLLGIYEKAVQYQFFHALALGFTGLWIQNRPESRWLLRAGWLFAAGILLFSGSLYLLACRDVLPFPVTWAGPITPLGGLSFIAGWSALLLSFREKSHL